MTRLVLFDTYVDTFQVAEAVRPAKTLAGVKTFELLESSTSPRFCLFIETDDAHDAAIAAQINSTLQNYADYVSRVSHLVMKKVSL